MITVLWVIGVLSLLALAGTVGLYLTAPNSDDGLANMVLCFFGLTWTVALWIVWGILAYSYWVKS